VARHIFQACTVRIYTQSNITSKSSETTTKAEDERSYFHERIQLRVSFEMHGFDRFADKNSLVAIYS
jgi:hypothetical protein